MDREPGGQGELPKETKEIDGRTYEKVTTPTGEWVDRSKNLLKPENPGAETWRAFRALVDPRPSEPGAASLYEGLGITSSKWDGLVEHNLAVSAGSRTLAEMVGADADVAGQAGAIQDAGKAYDLELKAKTREKLGDETALLRKYVSTGEKPEGLDTHVVDEMRRTGCSTDAIIAALNTGRLRDRYIEDPDERMAEIRKRSLEENLVAYVDARTLNSTIVPLDDARMHYLKVKPDEKSQEFFGKYWTEYYRSVEQYLVEQSGGRFDPSELTNEKVFATVQDFVTQQGAK
jgi:hypothetical protein